MQLFNSYDLAGLDMPNRIVMAPMTRSRAANGVADVLTERYYSQRASAGLIITEGIAVSQQGTGYLFTPGLYTDDQGQAWRRVTEAVHAAGGRIFAQLWHVGRHSHVSLQQAGAAPVAPCARRADLCLGGARRARPCRHQRTARARYRGSGGDRR